MSSIQSDAEHLDDALNKQEFRATSKRTSRPRSKLSGKARANCQGIVMSAARGRYIVEISDESVICARARTLRETNIVCADLVNVYKNEGLARIESIVERKNVIRRTADDKKDLQKTIAANVDLVVLVTSTCSPDIQPDFIRRVASEASFEGAKLCIALTKTDLTKTDLAPAPSVQFPADTVYDVHSQFNEFLDHLQDKTSVFIGLSGSGKSTLINRIIPGAKRKTGEVSDNGDGKHTSTSSEAFRLPTNPNSLIIDTPGIRSFGLGHII